MTVIECLETISLTDAKYDNEEDKNYYLIHKFMELIVSVKDKDIEELKDKIIEQYNYNTYSSFREYVCVMSKENVLPNDNQVEDTSRVKVEITNIIDFYNSYDENLIRYIKGHMFLEFAMNTIIVKSLKVNTKKKTFAKKIDLLFNN
jgi:predicted oxidoreductase